jgi:hypothetical protein
MSDRITVRTCSGSRGQTPTTALRSGCLVKFSSKSGDKFFAAIPQIIVLAILMADRSGLVNRREGYESRRRPLSSFWLQAALPSRIPGLLSPFECGDFIPSDSARLHWAPPLGDKPADKRTAEPLRVCSVCRQIPIPAERADCVAGV